MVTATLVDRDIQNGQRLLDRLADEGFAVKAACWIKEPNRSRPALFIATPLVDEKGFVQAHHALHPILQTQDGGLWFQGASTRLVSATHPLVSEALSLRSQHQEGFLHPDVSTFGGMAVDEVYVYPPSEAFPGFNQIKQKFPSAEVFTVALPGDPALPANWGFHPTVTSLNAKVNSQEFEGKPSETLYFVGPRYSRDDNVKQLVFAYRPEGWNTMYDPKTKQWQRVVFEKMNRPLFEPADFTPLLELKSQPVATN